MGNKRMSEKIRLRAIDTLAPNFRPARVYVTDAKLKQRAAASAVNSPIKFSNGAFVWIQLETVPDSSCSPMQAQFLKADRGETFRHY